MSIVYCKKAGFYVTSMYANATKRPHQSIKWENEQIHLLSYADFSYNLILLHSNNAQAVPFGRVQNCGDARC
jgi:hypothetical protein